mgnify:CR=1 FL=1
MFICPLPLHAVLRVSSKRIMHQTQIGHQVANNIFFIASCFYKASVACFQLKIARYCSQKKHKQQMLSQKKQNPINPNKRFGFKGE